MNIHGFTRRTPFMEFFVVIVLVYLAEFKYFKNLFSDDKIRVVVESIVSEYAFKVSKKLKKSGALL